MCAGTHSHRLRYASATITPFQADDFWRIPAERAPWGFGGGSLTSRCLVVDDYQDGADALGVFLTVLGLDVCVVFSGRAAIELAQSFRPRLVILDIDMPGLDGFQTLGRLKQQSWAMNAVFVAHTGMWRPPGSNAMFADFHHVLTKGHGSEALEAIVGQLALPRESSNEASIRLPFVAR